MVESSQVCEDCLRTTQRPVDIEQPGKWEFHTQFVFRTVHPCVRSIGKYLTSKVFVDILLLRDFLRIVKVAVGNDFRVSLQRIFGNSGGVFTNCSQRIAEQGRLCRCIFYLMIFQELKKFTIAALLINTIEPDEVASFRLGMQRDEIGGALEDWIDTLDPDRPDDEAILKALKDARCRDKVLGSFGSSLLTEMLKTADDADLDAYQRLVDKVFRPIAERVVEDKG